ncbi:MAG: nicotinate-nucleotide--dimethylbenzimidazole phosphoribosyltransferase [Spirochaetales bacterium]|nr:nicotinate-nucleotide--dimethylbenzimidazole phosphoribosyltransferase [Spirochaetales bacterium]
MEEGKQMGLLNETLLKIEPQDTDYRHRARNHLEQLTMPHWALGRLMDLAIDIAGITRSLTPAHEKRTVLVMAGDHGVASEGVSKYPKEVTVQMVKNFTAGGAAVNALAQQAKASIVIVDMGVDGDLDELVKNNQLVSCKIRRGTSSITSGPAMKKEEAIRSIEGGISAVLLHAADADIIGTGDMGIGNTTPSSAITACITESRPEDVTGRGTGIDDRVLKHKIGVVKKALSVNSPDKNNAIDVLSKVGGFEIGGIAGVILAAASLQKPVLVDGFISTAGALIAALLAPDAKDYMIAAHNSVEHGHMLAWKWLGKKPLLDLDLRLGEGTGAVLAMNLIEAAIRIMTEVSTFDEAEVSKA